MFKSVLKTNEIEFLCAEEDYGVMPEPYPARKFIPEWFKALPPKIGKLDKLENSTIKRCPPFLDAMSVGWIIPLAADVEFTTNDNASHVTYKSNFYRVMIDNHSESQISTPEAPNPNNPKPPMKFRNYWIIKAPKDYSILFLPPLNRPDPRFTCISGLVDCDQHFTYVNFPFFFNIPNYTGIIRAGTPLVQAIPIKRTNLIKKFKARIMTKKEKEEHDRYGRKRQSHESYYRDNIWERK
jgi:hypothetical protein